MSLTAGTAALGVLVRTLGGRLPGRPAAWHDVDLGGVRGRMWAPPRATQAPPLLCVAGVTQLGPADPRVMRLAEALARSGRVVFVPELALPQHRLEEADVDRLVTAVDRLDRGGGVSVLGFSFGGSYALLAAADPATAGRLRVVATFGAYAEMTSVLGRLVARGIDDAARAAIASALGLDAGDVERLAQLLDEGAPAGDIVAALPGELARLPARLSPTRVAGRVHVPIVALHAVDDPVVPATELERLAAAFPHARTYRVRLFTHVDFVPSRDLLTVGRDLWAVWDFARRLLAA